MSRFFLAVPIFFPPTMLYLIEKRNMMPRNFYLKTILEVSFICCELYVAAPFAIAVYPQTATIKGSELEKEFQDLKNARGELITDFVFNKGL